MSALLNDILTIDARPAEAVRFRGERDEAVHVKFIISDVDVALNLVAQGIDPVSATPAERAEARSQFIREFICR